MKLLSNVAVSINVWERVTKRKKNQYADVFLLCICIIIIRSLTKNKHKVITFGGSYSGGTSAWFRMAYPEISTASISSSGVVNAIVNFTSFDAQVAEAIDLPTAGCAEKLAQHVQVLEEYFSKGDKNKVKRRFGAENLVDTQMGDADFWYMVADGAAMADQVSENIDDVHCWHVSILVNCCIRILFWCWCAKYGSKVELCKAMQNTSLPSSDIDSWSWVENYANFVTSFWGNDFASGCFYDSEWVYFCF